MLRTHIDSPKAVGQRVTAARNHAGKGLRELADDVACSPSHLSRIENGKKAPSLEMLRSLAIWLNVTTTWLARGEEEPDPVDEIFERATSEDLRNRMDFDNLTDVERRFLRASLKAFRAAARS